MSKLIPFLVAGVGASSVSVGGVFMLKKTGGEGASPGKDSQDSQSTPPIPADLGFKDLAGFKSNNGGECAKKYVGTLTYPSGTKTSSETIDANYFSGSEEVQSCLVINWERTDTSADTNHGKGEFRGLGTFVKGDKGIVAFVSYKPHSTTDKKMSVEGGLYVVQKTNGSSTGAIQKYSEPTSIEITDLEGSFPKKGEGMTAFTVANAKSADYWGFLNNTTDLNTICKTGDTASCPENPSQEKKLKVSWQGTTPSDNTQHKTIDQWGQTVPAVMGKLFNGGTFTNAFSAIKGVGTQSELKEPASNPT